MLTAIASLVVPEPAFYSRTTFRCKKTLSEEIQTREGFPSKGLPGCFSLFYLRRTPNLRGEAIPASTGRLLGKTAQPTQRCMPCGRDNDTASAHAVASRHSCILHLRFRRRDLIGRLGSTTLKQGRTNVTARPGRPHYSGQVTHTSV